MSVLVVGISHNSAPVALLETVALSPDDVRKLAADVVHTDHITEATIIATCNRVEIYAEVDRFHGSVEDVSRLLIERANSSIELMLPHLYVHYDDAAVSHLFRVAAGLDSMAVGEAQILGQTRSALQVGQEQGTVGTALNTLFQQALRVGKRSHAETDIDRAAPSLVAASLARAEQVVGPIEGKKVVVIGAGGMAGLAAATVRRGNPAELVVVNRTQARAASLAQLHDGRPAELSALRDEIVDADIVIACAGARGVLITADAVRPGKRAFIDLALPHDIDPAVADVEGATLIGLATLAQELHDSDAGAEVEAVRAIVAQEVTAFLGARQQAAVTPTVVALRSMATNLVDAEMTRLDARMPDLDADVRSELLQTVRRVVDKLLHEPTVRVKELANEAGGVSYERALAELFALDPAAVSAVSRPDIPLNPGEVRP